MQVNGSQPRNEEHPFQGTRSVSRSPSSRPAPPSFSPSNPSPRPRLQPTFSRGRVVTNLPGETHSNYTLPPHCSAPFRERLPASTGSPTPTHSLSGPYCTAPPVIASPDSSSVKSPDSLHSPRQNSPLTSPPHLFNPPPILAAYKSCAGVLRVREFLRKVSVPAHVPGLSSTSPSSPDIDSSPSRPVGNNSFFPLSQRSPGNTDAVPTTRRPVVKQLSYDENPERQPSVNDQQSSSQAYSQQQSSPSLSRCPSTVPSSSSEMGIRQSKDTNTMPDEGAYHGVSGDSYMSPTADSGMTTKRAGSISISHPGAQSAKPKPPSADRKEIDNKDPVWTYRGPPNNQRTFYIPEENLEFSSQFDSGNLIHVERVGPYKYNLYPSMDCGNDERQTNNRQWFHFSVRGGAKGSTLNITIVGLVYTIMYTYDWMPVMAVLPNRPAYVRLPGKATTVALDAMPPTPGYPMLAIRDPAERRKALEGADPTTGGGSDDNSGDEGDDPPGGGGGDDDDDHGASPVDANASSFKAKKKKKKRSAAMNLVFDIRLDYEIQLKSKFPIGSPECPAMYIASNHPYSYSTLQNNLIAWQRQAATRAGISAVSIPSDKALRNSTWNFAPNLQKAAKPDIYFHREVLCKSLEGHNVDLITITDMNGVRPNETMAPLTFNGEATPTGLPHSSARRQTLRPRRFQGKQYVVLSARVHAAECPGSHMMHGVLEFLMNAKDPRAIALRRNFVFFLVPMLNPDGVMRGHSRVDANGVDLNRMYRTPSIKKHPAAYGLWALLSTLAAERKLALYIDMHAHANKKGTFFYGNGMDAAHQVENLLYAKLVSLNTPYLEFKSCNFSESNMSAVTRSGLSKDCSCRVVLYTETGVIFSYAVEASHVAGKTLNPIEPLSSIPGEESETVASTRYSPATFADSGKAILLALLDLKGLNPASRIPLTPYQSVKGVALFLQRQLQLELAEKMFEQSYQENGCAEPTEPSQTLVAAIMAKVTAESIPEKVTVRLCRALPPTTVSNVERFLPVDLASSLLAQNPASGPPRSLLSGPTRRKVAARPSPVTHAPDGAFAATEPTPASPAGGRSLAVTPQRRGVNSGTRSETNKSQTLVIDGFTAAVMEASNRP